MRWLAMMTAAVAATTAVPGEAWAAETRPVFATAAVDDATLAQARGGQSPFRTLTIGSTYRLADAEARSFFRAGMSARIEMDVWWGTVGAELVATSVRAGSR